MPSPSGKYRLNAYYTGQECLRYFIQKQNNGWKKVLELSDIYRRITEEMLCSLGETFWTDDQTLYAEILEFDGENETSTYYQFKIKPTPAGPKLAFEGTETPFGAILRGSFGYFCPYFAYFAPLHFGNCSI